MLVLGIATNAQRPRSVSEKSYESARRTLDAGVQALGGTEAFLRIDDISLKYTAQRAGTGAGSEREPGKGFLGPKCGLRKTHAFTEALVTPPFQRETFFRRIGA